MAGDDPRPARRVLVPDAEARPGDARLEQGSTESFLCLLQQPVAEYTLRDLRDAVQNLQLQWCGDAAAGRGHAVEASPCAPRPARAHGHAL